MLCLAAIGVTSAAGAEASVGGIQAPGTVAVTDVTCVVRCVDTRKASYGARVRVRGQAMDQVSSIVFRGGEGPIAVSPLRSSKAAAIAQVPRGALSSRPYVIDSIGAKSKRSPYLLRILPATAIPKATFPVRGRHSYWDGFGAGRGHQGTDVGARCGTPLVAALPGTVRDRSYQGAAGNYVVIEANGLNADMVYMHMLRPGVVRPGQKVHAGQIVGYVGETGRASGCHLHFEYWVGGWWRGGSPIDPMPLLRQWDNGETSTASRLQPRRARGGSAPTTGGLTG